MLEKREGRFGPVLFNSQEQEILRRCAGAGQSLHAAALEITRLRYPPEEGAPARELKTPHGAVAREVRPVRYGMMLIYPLVPRRARRFQRVVNGRPVADWKSSPCSWMRPRISAWC